MTSTRDRLSLALTAYLPDVLYWSVQVFRSHGRAVSLESLTHPILNCCFRRVEMTSLHPRSWV